MPMSHAPIIPSRRRAVAACALLVALALPGSLQAADPATSARRPAEMPPSQSAALLDVPELGAASATATATLAPDAGSREIVVEFEGETLALLSGEQEVEPVVTLSGGEVLATRLEPQTGDAPWRLVIAFDPQGERQIEMRAFLRLYSQAVTEAWVYSWNR